MIFDDLLSSDLFGPVCVAEGDLNAVFARADKPVQVPRTCLPAGAPRTPEALAWALGHEPTAAEWGGYSYAWFRAEDPGRVLFDSSSVALVPPAADVPLPAGGPLLAAALLGAAVMTKFRNSWRASGKSRAGSGCGAGNHPYSRCDASQPSDLHSRRAVAGEAPAHRAGPERHQAPGLPTNSMVRGRKMTTIVHLFTVRAAYVPPAWRMFIPPLLQAGVIGLGIVAGSVVLQLSGALCLLALAILYGVPDRDDVLTIDEARTRLDAIEREGVWQ